MNSFVLCVRDTMSDNNTFGIGMGPVSYLQVPDNITKPTPSHKIRLGKWFDNVISQAMAPNTPLDIIFFVHGYNTNAEEALSHQRSIEDRLQQRGINCMVIGFDWPTAGSALSYLYDRSQAADAAIFLVKGGIVPFTKYTSNQCAITVHVMAHSMGGFVVREAFRTVDKSRSSVSADNWRVGQVVLFAADLSSDCFALNSQDMIPIINRCGRITNYFSGHDEALMVSNLKNLDVSSRLGRVGMPVETSAHKKALDVDCGPRYIASSVGKIPSIDGSHSWYFNDDVWYDDLAFTIQGTMDRSVIPTRAYIGVNDFILKE